MNGNTGFLVYWVHVLAIDDDIRLYVRCWRARSRPPVERNPTAIKQMLLDWCKAQCEGYEVCKLH